MRFIKLNQQYTTELFVKESDQVNEEDEEEEEEEREQDESESPRKKFKCVLQYYSFISFYVDSAI